eukprot:CAMPEP_0198530164 /NCGR_PEP_ID=MMETSP1462-20131121/26192_1 /TAXON_ID=1333877 /ORGANISM="Brandtodinium nutriculum, Strain RCC3387" /LENGTH=245 /DNA_ID=CAMNT_0044260033 /DNA_START=45 /DNA_END=779 /DNA_ORIENTATION=+
MPDFKLREAFTEQQAEAEAEGADEYKKKGNAAFQAQNWDEAIKNYNKAIQLDPKQAAFYSNRAACWSSKGSHESALADANRCLEADPDFVKGYSRKGKALFDLQKLDEAEAAYQEGLAKDPANAGIASGLADVKRARAEARQRSSTFGGASSSGGFGGFGNLGNLGGLGKRLMDTLKKGGIGGRMQMYAVVMSGYFLYNNYVKGGSKTTGSREAGDDAEPASAGAASPLRRGFSQVDGSWYSFLE